ncbi:hypothetical protein JRI60_38295 [Archangium violaceum]|uniref:hypothetical protein n=1 Tax=Archangium violaceum TaxID=83451 RepID=UPI00194EFD19|nr:hypothetical protein [Archangium violaceum]QRN94912.1 hypothetical protein JRI60_38295 [Archangium violaceum]
MPRPAQPAPLFTNEQGQPRSWVPVGPALEANPEPNTPQARLGLAVDPTGAPIVSWGEDNGAVWGYFFRRAEGNVWSQAATSVFPLPASTFSPPGRPVFAVDPQGRPVMALIEATGHSTSTVRLRRWEGRFWSVLGLGLQAANNRLTEVSSASLAFNCSGEPVVAWGEIGPDEPSLGIHVSQWDGQSWQRVGERLSAYPDGVRGDGSNGIRPSLAVDSRGLPVVAWEESAMREFISRIHVRQWDGTRWLPVGGGVASEDMPSKGDSYSPALVLDGADVPYLTWTQYEGEDSRVLNQVRRPSGARWEGILEAGPRSEPVLAALGSRVFLLFAREDRLEIHTWDGQAWQLVGGPLQALPGETKLGEWALAVDPRGLPVVAWVEYSRNPFSPGKVGPVDWGETQVHVWRFQ